MAALANKCDVEIESLIIEHRLWALSLARKIMFTMGLPRSQAQEYRSAALLGLVEAAKRFSPDSGKEFRQFAFLRVRGAVIDTVRKSSMLSVRAYQYLKALNAMQELRKQTKLDLKNMNPSKKISKMLNYGSNGLLAFRLSVEDLESLIVDNSTASNPEAFLSDNQQKGKLLSELNNLPSLEQTIIKEHYLVGKSFTEIARSHAGKSKSWVSKLHHRALNRLREALKANS